MTRAMIVLGTLITALPLLIDSTLKGAGLLLVAGVTVSILGKASAAIRHFVWLFALSALLALPILSGFLPRWAVLPRLNTEVATSVHSLQPQKPVEPHSNQTAALKVEPPLADGVEAELPIASHRRLHAQDWFLLGWAIGFTLLVMRLATAQWFLRRAETRCVAVGDGPLEKAKEEARQQLNIRRLVQLLLDSRRTIPMAWGAFRPRVLLPAEAADWDEARLRAVLLHEMAHIKRGDAVARWIVQLSCALHWFNPLVWFAAWRLRVESERACDDLVVTNGVRASDYANHLLHVATSLSPQRMTQACGLAMACPTGLEGRLLAVLNRRANRGRVSRAVALAALVLGLCVVIPVAMLGAAPDKTLSDPSIEGRADNENTPNEEHPIVVAATNSLLPGSSAAKPTPSEGADASDNSVNGIKLLHAEGELKRATKLREQNLISESDFNKAKTKAEIARAEFAGRADEVARIKLRGAETELEHVEQLRKVNIVSEHEVEQAKYQVALLRAQMIDDATETTRVQFRQAEAEFKRASQLFDQNLVSESTYNEAKEQFELRLAELRQADIERPATKSSTDGQILVEANIIEAPAKERIPDDPSNLTNIKGINVLSSPRVLTGIGEEAEIFVGEERPMNAAPSPREYVRTGITLRVRPKLEGDRIAYTARLTLADLIHSEAKDTQTISETSSDEIQVSGTAKDGEGTWFHFTEYRKDKKIAVRAVWLKFTRQH